MELRGLSLTLCALLVCTVAQQLQQIRDTSADTFVRSAIHIHLFDTDTDGGLNVVVAQSYDLLQLVPLPADRPTAISVLNR
jgi:hypothetical protein